MNQETPDILAKFQRLREKLDEFSNRCADDLGESHRVTLEAELLYMRVIDLTDDLETIASGLYLD